MTSQMEALEFSVLPISPHLAQITITVPNKFVDTLYQQAVLGQRNEINAYGFHKSSTPLRYIEEHLKTALIEHIKEFLFKYLVLGFLYQKIHEHKLCLVGEPRIEDIKLAPGEQAYYYFQVSVAGPLSFQEWKLFPFKAPNRKNYKDIDRQVETFMKEELELQKARGTDDAIAVGDLVCFDIFLADQDYKSLLDNYLQTLWVKIGDEEADLPYQELFAGKRIGDSFYTNNTCFQEFFSNQLDTHYLFGIIIKDIQPHAFFSFEEFKRHFRIKNNKELHQKLIEVFSFRNDLSQRRAMVEEVFKLLLAKHSFEVPHYFILRQQQAVLDIVHNNPDYQVYKTQKNFKEDIKKLAAKQLKEIILIDQLSHKENISVGDGDVKFYLNFLKRARTKEFLYFIPPLSKMRGQEIPIPSQLIKQSCLREKTLNHLVYHLTKK